MRYGASVRATQFLTLAAKARALMAGRYHVTGEDMRALALPVLRHRVLTNYQAESDGMTVDKVLTTCVDSECPAERDELSDARSHRLLTPETLAGLANLELVARTAVEGFLIGLHRSPHFGFSQEFAEYRAYAEGDDPRFVDWNVYARTERTYIRRYEGETNTRLMILLDASASMGYSSGKVSKLQYGKFLAAALAYLAARQHDPVGLDRVRRRRSASTVRPSSRAGSLQGVLHAIDRA